jgi:hypothetical protein
MRWNFACSAAKSPRSGQTGAGGRQRRSCFRLLPVHPGSCDGLRRCLSSEPSPYRSARHAHARHSARRRCVGARVAGNLHVRPASGATCESSRLGYSRPYPQLTDEAARTTASLPPQSPPTPYPPPTTYLAPLTRDTFANDRAPAPAAVPIWTPPPRMPPPREYPSPVPEHLP